MGVGGKLLDLAVEGILEREPGALIKVCPGGYDGNTEAQFRFYKKHGFVETEDRDTLVYARPRG